MRKVLVLGATGMLGHQVFIRLSTQSSLEVYGTYRNTIPYQLVKYHQKLLQIDDLASGEALNLFFSEPNTPSFDYVINCAGAIKQRNPSIEDLVTLNTLLPYWLSKLSDVYHFKTVNFSTDCVFSGKKGAYTELDVSDAVEAYGKTKYLGEINHENTLNIRTSMIGHELSSAHSLLEWFLAQEDTVFGFKNAIFSGFPTYVIADFLGYILTNSLFISGTYHFSSEPIDKCTLLELIAKEYSKPIRIIPRLTPSIDRSLDSSLLRERFSFTTQPWPIMIKSMRAMSV